MHRRKRLGPIAVAVLLVLAACGGDPTPTATTSSSVTAEPGPTETTADPIPTAAEAGAEILDGTFDTIAGDTIDLASLQGQDIVFWFWAPW